jgi:hypothetical protein
MNLEKILGGGGGGFIFPPAPPPPAPPTPTIESLGEEILGLYCILSKISKDRCTRSLITSGIWERRSAR